MTLALRAVELNDVRRRFELARVSAALAVGAVVAGWAFSQYPRFLPGLTIEQAAAERSTLLAVVIGVGAGAIVLVPSLALLFWLFLRGRLDTHAGVGAPAVDGHRASATGRPARLGRFAVACLLAGVALMVCADLGWAHVMGVASLFASAASTFILAADIPTG